LGKKKKKLKWKAARFIMADSLRKLIHKEIFGNTEFGEGGDEEVGSK